MMSPNGSIPPIHVPPGYISQVSLFLCVFFLSLILFDLFFYVYRVWVVWERLSKEKKNGLRGRFVHARLH